MPQVLDTAVSLANSDERSYDFVAWGLHPRPPRPEEEELIVSRRLPFSDAVRMAFTGDIAHVGSVALLLAIDARVARGELPAGLLEILARAS